MRLPREFNENIKDLTVNRLGLISTSAWLHDSTKELSLDRENICPGK